MIWRQRIQIPSRPIRLFGPVWLIYFCFIIYFELWLYNLTLVNFNLISFQQLSFCNCIIIPPVVGKSILGTSNIIE